MNDLYKKLSDASKKFKFNTNISSFVPNYNLGPSYKMNFEYGLQNDYHSVTKNGIVFHYSDSFSYIKILSYDYIYYTLKNNNGDIYLNVDIENLFKNNPKYKLIYSALYLYKQNLLEHQKDFGFKIKKISFLEASKIDNKQYNPVSFLLFVNKTKQNYDL